MAGIYIHSYKKCWAILVWLKEGKAKVLLLYMLVCQLKKSPSFCLHYSITIQHPTYKTKKNKMQFRNNENCLNTTLTSSINGYPSQGCKWRARSKTGRCVWTWQTFLAAANRNDWTWRWWHPHTRNDDPTSCHDNIHLQRCHRNERSGQLGSDPDTQWCSTNLQVIYFCEAFSLSSGLLTSTDELKSRFPQSPEIPCY